MLLLQMAVANKVGICRGWLFHSSVQTMGFESYLAGLKRDQD